MAHFDAESRAESRQWKHPASLPLKKPGVVRSDSKVIARRRSGTNGVLPVDFLEQRRTIIGEYNVGIAASVNNRKQTWIDVKRYAPVPRQRIGAQEQGSDQRWGAMRLRVVATPALFSGLEAASSDYHLFPKMKEQLRGRVFSDDEETMAAALNVPRTGLKPISSRRAGRL